MACLLVEAGRALKNTGLQFKGVLGLKKGKSKDQVRDSHTSNFMWLFVDNRISPWIPDEALEEIYEHEGWNFAYLQQQRLNCINYPVKQYKF